MMKLLTADKYSGILINRRIGAGPIHITQTSQLTTIGAGASLFLQHVEIQEICPSLLAFCIEMRHRWLNTCDT